MQIFNELKARGVEDVLFISMDGVSGLEEGAKAIQGCSSAEMYSAFNQKFNKMRAKQGLQEIYEIVEKSIWSVSLAACKKSYEQFCQEWYNIRVR